MARKSTGKRQRFRIFERDSFTCQYCGKRPPEVVLHLDHIVPVSKGGQDDDENLITSCADCNLGKAAFKLGNLPKQAQKNSAAIAEKYEQLKAFYNYQQKTSRLKEALFDDVYSYWIEVWDCELRSPLKSSLRNFLKTHSVDEIKDAIDLARSWVRNARTEDGFRYMCGVLHKQRKEREQSL